MIRGVEKGKVFVITGPSGVGKGTLIERLLDAVPELELSVSATTREPRAGEVDGRDYHFLTPEEFERRVEAADFLEHATYSGNRYGTLREEVERRLAEGRSVVLEIEVQGARQVRAAMPEAVLIFIAPPDPAALRERLEGGGRTRLRRSRGGSGPPRSSSRPRMSSPRRRERRGAEVGLRAGGSSGASCPYTDGPMSMIRPRSTSSRPHRHPLRRRPRCGEAGPPDQRVLPLALRGRVRRVHAPMVEVPSGNYLTIALEETAAGKLKYEYKS